MRRTVVINHGEGGVDFGGWSVGPRQTLPVPRWFTLPREQVPAICEVVEQDGEEEPPAEGPVTFTAPAGWGEAPCLYVLAAWAGPRRGAMAEYGLDPSFYLRVHLAHLATLRHNCAVLVVDNRTPEPVPAYEQFLAALPDGVALLRRPNRGMSYGAWSEAYGLFRSRFLYYVVIEDDYLPAPDHFDTLLRDLLEEKQVGYLGSHYNRGPNLPHLGASSGIMKQAAMEAVWCRYGRLPHSDGASYGPCQQEGQVSQSRAFLSVGWGIADFTDHYSTPFYDAFRQCIRVFGTGPPMFVPLQQFTGSGPRIIREEP